MPGSPSTPRASRARTTAPSWADDPSVDADAFDRLAGDRQLEHRLRESGFRGAEFDYFQNEAARYGFAVIAAWLRRGEITAKCQERRVRGTPDLDLAELGEDDVTHIAGESVALALVAFRDKVLVPGKWDPSRGASLRTFFVGQCLFQYPTAVRRWQRENPPRRELFLDDFDDAGLPHTAISIEKQVLDRIAAEDALGRINDPARRRAVQMYAEGYGLRDIAQVLERTPKAVEHMLAKVKKANQEEAV